MLPDNPTDNRLETNKPTLQKNQGGSVAFASLVVWGVRIWRFTVVRRGTAALCELVHNNRELG